MFSVEAGKIRAHVTPTIQEDENLERPALRKLLHCFETGPGLTCCSSILSGDPTGGDLLTLPQHAHFFSRDGSVGGHFEEGVTRDEMHYIGYYAVASSVYRLNNPGIKY